MSVRTPRWQRRFPQWMVGVCHQNVLEPINYFLVPLPHPTRIITCPVAAHPVTTQHNGPQEAWLKF
jgi:hypothetical protein